jgi:Tol biopolymer transport system component
MKSCALFFVSILCSAAFGQEEYNHPELDWFSFETDHFVVHFHQGSYRTAALAGEIGEDIYIPVTRLYNFTPDGKIHFIIRDTDDYSNGGAYFFDNKIEIWAENLDYVLRGTQNWLRNVITHEFTHMISIQKSIKFSRQIPYGFFQYFDYEPERRQDVVRGFPNTLVSLPISSIDIPVWFAEGVAQYQVLGARYDYRDPHREMIVRDMILHDALLDYKELGVFGKTSLGNEAAYNLGYSFVEFLCLKYGDDILRKISEINSGVKVLTFNKALFQATGLPADSLYDQWKNYLDEKYTRRLRVIRDYQLKGQLIEAEGFANLYPVWSPAGDKIAYTSSGKNDYISQNKLMIFDRATGKKEALTSHINFSLSWSNSGRYLAFSRATRETWSMEGSTFNDLWLYDLQEKKEIRLTRQMRGRNPDWNRDDSKLVFVAETNGLNQLFVLELGGRLDTLSWHKTGIDRETGQMRKGDLRSDARKVRYYGKSLRQLLVFDNARQIYHPRWSADDRMIIFDTSTDYGRDIALYDVARDTLEMMLTGPEEERYPVFTADTNSVYYASSRTGIYNLYRMDRTTGIHTLLTNVTGGAMMPDVNRQGELVYSCYDSLGYHLYVLTGRDTVEPAHAVYEENYRAGLPLKNFNDDTIPEWKYSPYKPNYTGLHFMPRLLIDYGTVKPGFYLQANDVLDRMTLFAAADMNLNLDYDLYAGFEYHKLTPTIFLEGYNLNANITDTLIIPTGEENEVINQDINFNLTEVHVGARFEFPAGFKWRTALVLSIYNATLNWFDPFEQAPFTFRYRYLNGRACQVQLTMDRIRVDRFRDISPGGGRYLSFLYAYEFNDFLVNFDFSSPLSVEIFELYRYNRLELDWEEYFTNPFIRSHSFSARIQAGYIDRPVDDFFHLFAGGFVGMKGYSYYSIEGTKKLITTLSYRLPVFRNINQQLATLYLDNLYLGVFYDYGNAWIDDEPRLTDFKRDIGFQLRLECFTNYLFPTKFFWEAVYPLEKVTNASVQYGQGWRYYFGILFTFDIRERNGYVQRGIPGR